MPFWKRDKTDDDRSEKPLGTGGATPVDTREGTAAREGGNGGAAAEGPRPDATSPAGPGASSPASPQAAGETAIDATMLEAKVVEVIRTCYDPEIPVNIYELGLIYDVAVKPGGDVYVKMTLTSPMCPVAGTLPHEVEAKVASVTGVKSAQVDVVWDPPWGPEKMSEAAKLQLGML